MYEKIIVAVDFGTSAITAVAAKKNERGILSVLSVETAESKGSILRGRIYNQEEVIHTLDQLINTLNRKHSIKIDKMYVGVGGQSMRSVAYTVAREMNDEPEVTQKVLDSMLEECLNHEPEDGVVLGAVSPEYRVDGRQETNPRGVQCHKLEAKYQLIVGRPSLERSLYDVAKKVDVQLAGIVPSVEAISEAVLNSSEKDLGCVLVDFGAGTTDVAVYKNRLLQFFVSIPLGSGVITKDLTSFNMTEEEADEFKMALGLALTDNVEEKQQAIEARFDEILTNVVVQLKRAGFEEIPSEGFILTGGGASLKKLPEAIQERLKCKHRIAKPKDSLFIQEAVLNNAPEYALVTGLLALGKENCAELIVKEEPVTVQTDLFGNTEPAGVKPKEEKPKKSEETKSSKGGLFGRLRDKVGKGVEGVSKSLFDDEM